MLEQIKIWDILVKSDLLNVIILAAAFIYLGNKFLPKIISERKKQITKELEGARKARVEASEELKKIEEKSKQATLEIEKIKDEARNTAATIKKQIEEEAEKELSELKLKIKREIGASYDDAIQNIKSSTSKVALKLAEEALTKISKDHEVQKKLMEDFLAELKTPNKN
ncbi:MAG: hypothetical protein HYY52_04050 [Candidatus Melainabacteria bacterium]|nr:hypothetical protein [Candidatus Melainabacteria bacterium]